MQSQIFNLQAQLSDVVNELKSIKASVVSSGQINTKINHGFISTAKIADNPAPSYEQESIQTAPPFTHVSIGSVDDKPVCALKIEIDESTEQRIKDIVKESLKEQPYLTNATFSNERYGNRAIDAIQESERELVRSIRRYQCMENHCIKPCDICGKGCYRFDGSKVNKGLIQKLKDAFAGTESMPIKVSNAEFGSFAGVSVGTEPLKPYEETQEAKLDAIGSLAAIIDVTDDHVTSLMLKKSIKQILQRDFKIDFDENDQEENPHIPQPRNP